MKMFAALKIAFVAAIAWSGAAVAQTNGPAQPIVPLGYCQLSASQLSASIGLVSCVRASFTGTGTGTNLVVTSVTGIILPGDTLAGTGVTAGTTIVSGPAAGGAGTYVTSAATTPNSASLTSGGVPPGATYAVLQAETADVRYRDDGGAPTSALGSIVVHATDPIFYTGTLSKLRFIAASGSPLLNISFYR